MSKTKSVLRRAAMAALAFSALIHCRGATAGIFATVEAVGRLGLDGNASTAIDTAPSLDELALRIAGEQDQVVAAGEGDGQSWTRWRSWEGRLEPADDRESDVSYVGAFGSLEEFRSTGEGIEVALEAMQATTQDAIRPELASQNLYFLLSGPLDSEQGKRLMAYGLYTVISGHSPDHWARLQQDQAGAVTNLALDADADETRMAASGAEMPIPATPMLLLAGLLGWRLMRGRGS